MGLKRSLYIIKSRGHHSILKVKLFFPLRFEGWFSQFCHSPSREQRNLHLLLCYTLGYSQWRQVHKKESFFTYWVDISSLLWEDWNFFFRKWLLSDQSNVVRIFGVRIYVIFVVHCNGIQPVRRWIEVITYSSYLHCQSFLAESLLAFEGDIWFFLISMINSPVSLLSSGISKDGSIEVISSAPSTFSLWSIIVSSFFNLS